MTFWLSHGTRQTNTQFSPLNRDFYLEANMYKMLGKIANLEHGELHFEAASRTRQTYGVQTYGAHADPERNRDDIHLNDHHKNDDVNLLDANVKL